MYDSEIFFTCNILSCWSEYINKSIKAANLVLQIIISPLVCKKIVLSVQKVECYLPLL